MYLVRQLCLETEKNRPKKKKRNRVRHCRCLGEKCAVFGGVSRLSLDLTNACFLDLQEHVNREADILRVSFVVQPLSAI